MAGVLALYFLTCTLVLAFGTKAVPLFGEENSSSTA